jgi:hypothetical protein
MFNVHALYRSVYMTAINRSDIVQQGQARQHSEPFAGCSKSPMKLEKVRGS